MQGLSRLRRLLHLHSTRRTSGRHGSAAIEVALLCPWVIFLFVGVCDVGFYTTEMLGVENAARVAAEYTSHNSSVASDATGACARVLNEVAALPNVTNQTDCSASVASNTVVVTAAAVTGPDGAPATLVTVTYRGGQMIPIPGVLTGSLSISRNLQMRVKP